MAIVKTTVAGCAVMFLAFSSPELTSPAISDYLTGVGQPLLATVDGVASADILGGQTFAMRLWLDPTRLAARGISADDVAAAIRTNNFEAAPGQAKGYFTITIIVTDAGLTDIEQFRNMVVKAKDGALGRVRDVATVELGAEKTNSSVWMNGDHAVFIGVNATPTGNPLGLVKGVRKLLPEIERNLPPTVTMKVPYDSTKFIEASISEVEWTLGEAILIVVVVIFLFLGSFRSVVIPVVTIPLSLIGAATLMLAMGFSLNLLTLLAMVLAIGLVVDDAIVVVENVYRHIEEGKTPVQAAIIGAREIIGPIIAMTITLAAVYAPIGLLAGLTGTLFREFAFTLAGAVIISGVVALTLSPMMCSLFLTREMSEGRFAKIVDRSFSAVTRLYGRRLSSSLDYRPVTALFAIVVLASIPFFWLHTKTELAPAEDQGVMFGITKTPQYANLDYSNAFSARMDQIFAGFPETDRPFAINGTPNLNGGFAGMIVKPWGERSRSVGQLMPLVQQQLSRVDRMNLLIVSPPPLPGPASRLPVQLVISATRDYRTVFETMEKIKAAARKSGMFIVTDSDLAFNNPVIQLHVDRSKANELGITMTSVASTLALMVGENYVNLINLAGRSYKVFPQLPRFDGLDVQSLIRS